jgi:hypothetical protein
MCTGIAVALSEVPIAFADGLTNRIHDREGCRELRFHFWETPALLPVRWDGGLRLLRWGSHARRSPLPYGPWIAESQIEAGVLSHTHAERAIIPANLGFDRGTWFLIEEGIHGVVLPEVPGGPVVYLLTRPSTNYYRNMAGKCEQMPVLVNQLI